MLKQFSVVTVVCMILAACSSGPPPKQFILEPMLDPVNESDPPAVEAVGLAEVTVPAYANEQRLASRDLQQQIVYNDDIKWADSPDEALTRVLANRLRYYLCLLYTSDAADE